MKPRLLFIIIMSVVVIATIIGYQAVSSSKSKSDNTNPSSSPSFQDNPYSSSSNSSTTN